MIPTWRAVLVDSTGQVLAQMPDATIDPFSRTVHTVERCKLSVTTASDAGQLILAAEVLPLLEVQVWRDTRCVLWGPIVEAPVDIDAGTIDITVHGALVHFDRTLTGPAELTNEAANDRFATDLTDWSRWKTTFVEGGGFASIVWVDFDGDVAEITQEDSGTGGAPNAPTPSTGWAKLDGSALAEDEELQLYQDITVAASTVAPVIVTVRALFWVDVGQEFGPPDPGETGRTNLDHALVATVHDTAGEFDPPTPVGYIDFLTPPAVVSWDDIWAGRYTDIECTVEIPTGTGDRLVHLALVPPRLLTWATLVEMTVDRPLDLGNTATDRFGDLITHAQDAAYGHVDRLIDGNLVGSPSTVADEEPIMESDRRTILAALNEFTESGRIEWRVSYTGTTRTLSFGVPDIGTTHTERGLDATATARSPHLVSAQLQRRTPFTSVTGQSSQGQVRSDAAAVTVDDDLAWEMTLVAPKWVPRWALDEWTAERLREESSPDVLTVELDPVADDAAAWLDGTIDVLDFVPVTITDDGVDVAGLWQVRELTFNPATDGVTAKLVPEAA